MVNSSPGTVTMYEFKPIFRTTGVGSVPNRDPAEVLARILAAAPEIPFWTQLPGRVSWEDAILQFTPGLPALLVDPTERRVTIDPAIDKAEALTAFYEADLGHDWEVFALREVEAAGFQALVERVAVDKGTVERL